MKIFLRYIVILATAISLQVNAAKSPLDVQVSVASMKNGDVNATLTITNNSNRQQKILAWYTDLEEENIFKVLKDGAQVDFFGPHYKRHAPAEKDFIKLNAGEYLTKTFELTSLYDMNGSGNYEIAYDVTSFHLFGNTLQHSPSSKVQQLSNDAGLIKKAEKLQSNATYIYLDGFESKGITANKGDFSSARKNDCIDGTCFTGRCSTGEKNELISALGAANQIANSSVAYLNSHSSNNTSARYETWFGNATSTRYNTAVSHFNAINDVIDNQPITFDCSCNKSYFAYVYPSQPYKVYMCKSFWSADELGTDSRAGTIIHELSHFNVVAATDDVIYGQSGAQSLANSDPDQALNNADNHEYFAENTPEQN